MIKLIFFNFFIFYFFVKNKEKENICGNEREPREKNFGVIWSKGFGFACSPISFLIYVLFSEKFDVMWKEKERDENYFLSFEVFLGLWFVMFWLDEGVVNNKTNFSFWKEKKTISKRGKLYKVFVQ